MVKEMFSTRTKVKPFQAELEVDKKGGEKGGEKGGNWKGAEEALSFHSRFHSFLDDVSIVGLKYCADGKRGWFKRLIWLALVLTGFCFMTYQIVDRIQYFLTYPKTVAVSVNFNNSLLFPIVTICNVNVFSKRKAMRQGKTISNSFSPGYLFDNCSLNPLDCQNYLWSR